ncbi:MAG: hypothetical protein AAGA03_15345 [Planctomycetota bacterium]
MMNTRLATNQYFADLEDKIVEKLHQDVVSEEGRAELIRATGVEDAKLIEELTRLGITADGLIALRLFPLVLVAWAEANADAQERGVVMMQAHELGIREDTTAWVLLHTWLRKRPPGLCVDAWRRYLHGRFSNVTDTAAEKLIDLTRRQMTAVAKASGGVLGLGKVSEKEQLMIDRLVATMQHESTV